MEGCWCLGGGGEGVPDWKDGGTWMVAAVILYVICITIGSDDRAIT